MNTVISCSVMDEIVGLHILKNSQGILDERKMLLQKGVTIVENWIQKNTEFVEWVRPNAGALCCVRLRPDVFTDTEVNAFILRLAMFKYNLPLAIGLASKKESFD